MALEGTGPTGREDPAHGDLVALRAKLFYPDVDGVLFDEAARCFQRGAYRTALVMTWLAIAEGLRHRFEVAARQDRELTSLLEEIEQREKERYAIDSLLLDKAKQYELISDHEHKDLAHIRDQRNRYGHPGGVSPSRTQVLAALDAAVHIVLSRPAQHRTEWAGALVRRAATDRTFFARDPDALRAYARQIDPLLTREARRHLVLVAVEELDDLATDPARGDLAGNVAIMAGAILARHTELVVTLDLAARLALRERGVALVCLRPEVFERLDGPLPGAVLASVLESPTDAGSGWQPDVRILIRVQELHEAHPLPSRWAEQLDKHVAALPLNELAGLDFPAGPLAARLIEEMRSHNWTRENQACRALANLGPVWCSRLAEPVQEQLGRNVLQAAEGDAKDASWLLTRISFAADEWPQRFLYGIAAECVVHEHSRLRLKAEARDKVEAILGVRHDGNEIVQAVCEAVTAPGTFGKEPLLEQPAVEQGHVLGEHAAHLVVLSQQVGHAEVLGWQRRPVGRALQQPDRAVAQRQRRALQAAPLVLAARAARARRVAAHGSGRPQPSILLHPAKLRGIPLDPRSQQTLPGGAGIAAVLGRPRGVQQRGHEVRVDLNRAQVQPLGRQRVAALLGGAGQQPRRRCLERSPAASATALRSPSARAARG